MVDGRSQDFSKGGGGVTLCQTLSSRRFRHGILYVVCLKKDTKGGSRAPQDAPRYALDREI